MSCASWWATGHRLSRWRHRTKWTKMPTSTMLGWDPTKCDHQGPWSCDHTRTGTRQPKLAYTTWCRSYSKALDQCNNWQISLTIYPINSLNLLQSILISSNLASRTLRWSHLITSIVFNLICAISMACLYINLNYNISHFSRNSQQFMKLL